VCFSVCSFLVCGFFFFFFFILYVDNLFTASFLHFKTSPTLSFVILSSSISSLLIRIRIRIGHIPNRLCWSISVLLYKNQNNKNGRLLHCCRCRNLQRGAKPNIKINICKRYFLEVSSCEFLSNTPLFKATSHSDQLVDWTLLDLLFVSSKELTR